MAAAACESELRPGMVSVIQTFGDRINPHPHVHALVSRGGWTRGDRFIPSQWSRCFPATLTRLPSGASDVLPDFGDCVKSIALTPSGDIAVTGDKRGVIRIGRLGGESPHILLGHESEVDRVALSPDLRWVASTGDDDTLRLWPMPDLDSPPLHTLPHDELIAKLRSLTNLRAVRDAQAPDGWRIELAPFPGWQEVPTW